MLWNPVSLSLVTRILISILKECAAHLWKKKCLQVPFDILLNLFSIQAYVINMKGFWEIAFMRKIWHKRYSSKLEKHYIKNWGRLATNEPHLNNRQHECQERWLFQIKSPKNDKYVFSGVLFAGFIVTDFIVLLLFCHLRNICFFRHQGLFYFSLN